MMSTESKVNSVPAGALEASVPLIKLHEGSVWYHRKSLAFCSVACLATFQYGLDGGIVSGLQAMPGFLSVFGYREGGLWHISSTVQQLINSLMTVGAFVSSLLVGPLGKLIGRRWALFIACILSTVAVILMLASDKFAALYASRVIIGLANGLFMVETQLYIFECSPANYRGMLMGMFQVCLAFGSIIGSIANNYTSTRDGRSAYMIPCGIILIIPAFLMVGLPFLPESPRWLAARDQIEKARAALVRLRPSSMSPLIIDAELNEIKTAVELEKEYAKSFKIQDMFTGNNRRRTLLSFGLVLSLSATGNLFFIVYGTYFFQIAGETNAFVETIGMNVAGLGGVLISLWLITVVGRRLILLSGAAGQALCMLVIGATYAADKNSAAANKCLVAFVVIHIFVYTMCTAPYLYLVAGEIPSNSLRGFTVGTASSLGFLGAWLITFTAPYFINSSDLNWGPKYAWIWFGSNVAYFLFILFFVPETKDRTLEELDEMFDKKLPAWKFKKYVCTGIAAARSETIGVMDSKLHVEHVEMSQSNLNAPGVN